MKLPQTTNQLSRLDFMKTLASSTLVIGFNPISGSWITTAQAVTAAAFEKLPALDGTLHVDDTTRADYAQDYGQILHEPPLAVLKPGSVQDISRMVQYARRHGLRIAARGQGHSPFGQAQVRSGVVIDMGSLQTVHAIARDRLEADAGIEWRALVHATLAHGLTAPVLTNYLGLTLGGTLSIGGISPATYRYGAQVDVPIEHRRTLWIPVWSLAGWALPAATSRHTWWRGHRVVEVGSAARYCFVPVEKLAILEIVGGALV